MLEYISSDNTKRKCLDSKNIPFTLDIGQCFGLQQKQKQYGSHKRKANCYARKCPQNQRRQQLQLQMQPIQQMDELQSQLRPRSFDGKNVDAETSHLINSGISPKCLTLLSMEQQQKQKHQHQQQQQQRHQKQQYCLLNDKNCSSVTENPKDQYTNITGNHLPCAMNKRSLSSLSPPNDTCDNNACNTKPQFTMSQQFFWCLKKIHRNMCLTANELYDIQNNLWQLSQMPRMAITHNIQYMLEQYLLNDQTMNFLQSILCSMATHLQLSRHFVQQFLQALRNAIDLVNNYFHPRALLSTNDPYEMAQLNDILSMDVKHIYGSPNKWLYVKNFLNILAENKSTEEIIDYFLHTISKNILLPQALDVLQLIVKKTALNLTQTQLDNLQYALKECSNKVFSIFPILNRENALKAFQSPQINDFETAYRFTRTLSIFSLKQLHHYLKMDDIQDIINASQLKELFDYVNTLKDHELNVKRLNDFIDIAKKIDMKRYTLSNHEFKLAIRDLNSSDKLIRSKALAYLKDVFFKMPKTHLQNMVNNLRKCKLISCEQFQDIYNYVIEDEGKSKQISKDVMKSIEKVKETILQASQPLQFSDINNMRYNELANILQTIHATDAANYAQNIEINQLITMDDYHKLILKLSYMKSENVKYFLENLEAKQALSEENIAMLQKLLEENKKLLQLPRAKLLELKDFFKKIKPKTEYLQHVDSATIRPFRKQEKQRKFKEVAEEKAKVEVLLKTKTLNKQMVKIRKNRSSSQQKKIGEAAGVEMKHKILPNTEFIHEHNDIQTSLIQLPSWINEAGSWINVLSEEQSYLNETPFNKSLISITETKKDEKKRKFSKYSKIGFDQSIEETEPRTELIQRRSMETLFKELPYLKAVIHIGMEPLHKDLSKMEVTFPKPHMIPLSLKNDISRRSLDKLSHVTHYIPVTLSNSEVSHKVASTLNIKDFNNYIDLLNELKLLDTRSARSYIFDLYRKGILGEKKLKRLKEILNEHTIKGMTNSLRNAIAIAISDLITQESLNLLLHELKIEYVTPIYFQQYNQYKFRQPTPERHPMIDIHYNRGLCNLIKLPRRQVIYFYRNNTTNHENK